ncbi:MAG: hypothetical protein LC790_09625, partial [Actinobacteria bacterium]|nr:hypothetical protein [Actinomycetota bacterium]
IKQHYDRRRAAGDKHTAAMRNLFNRFLGCLYHCLQTGQTFDLNKAAAPEVRGAVPNTCLSRILGRIACCSIADRRR